MTTAVYDGIVSVVLEVVPYLLRLPAENLTDLE
jgi:hypothetical protein